LAFRLQDAEIFDEVLRLGDGIGEVGGAIGAGEFLTVGGFVSGDGDFELGAFGEPIALLAPFGVDGFGDEVAFVAVLGAVACRYSPRSAQDCCSSSEWRKQPLGSGLAGMGRVTLAVTLAARRRNLRPVYSRRMRRQASTAAWAASG
jgi:hypothetical protein